MSEWLLRVAVAVVTGLMGGLAIVTLDGGSLALSYGVGFICFVVVLWGAR
jgi:hypothetical protein